MSVTNIEFARKRELVTDAPRPRDRKVIEASISSAAMHNTSTGMMALQAEILLDIRDLVAECAVRLSNIEAEGRR